MAKFRFVLPVALLAVLLVQSCGGGQRSDVVQVTPPTTREPSSAQSATVASAITTPSSTAASSVTVSPQATLAEAVSTAEVEAPPTSAVNEPPALAPAVAAPTPDADSSPVEASEPARLIIPAIAVDAAPRAVGLDERRVPIVPKHEVGWFQNSAVPGQGSNVVFWGHVLRWKDSPSIPAPFARLSELQKGAEVVVVTAAGEQHHFRVTKRVQVRPNQVDYILLTTSERVTLVSCIDDTVIMDGRVSKAWRLIVIAEPV